jgi:predicted lipoprotein with Yx(FWY)xxD motif
MKRSMILAAGVAIVVSLTTGLAAASGGRATLQLRSSKFGKILVNGRGRTIYMFVADRRNKDNCVPIANCVHVWPLVTTTGTPVAKAGVKRSLIGTITLPNGTTQVTYSGHPLYTYIADTRPGQVFGEGVVQSGAKWYVLNGAGRVVK